MDVNVKRVEGATVIELKGRIDGHTAPKIELKILPLIQMESKIVLDMTQVTYISSVGLRMLATAYQQASSNDGRIVLAGLSERIRDTMSITGFMRYFAACETVEAGLAALEQE